MAYGRYDVFLDQRRHVQPCDPPPPEQMHYYQEILKEKVVCTLKFYLAPPPPRINPMEVPVSLRASREKSEFLRVK